MADYGIDPDSDEEQWGAKSRQSSGMRSYTKWDKSIIRSAARLRGNRNMTIRDEGDFIRKVKNRYHRKLNNDMATRIQAAVRGWLARRYYQTFR